MADDNQMQDHRIRNVDLTQTMRSSFWTMPCQLSWHVHYLMYVMG